MLRIKLSVLFICLVLTAQAEAKNINDFVKACLSATNMDESICECTAKKAKAELSQGGFDFLVATLNKDKKTSEALRWRLKTPELMAAGMFMAHGPGQCAKGTEGS